MTSLRASPAEITGSSLRSNEELSPARRTKGLTSYGSQPDHRPIDLWLDANEGPAPIEADSLLDTITPETLRRYPSTRDLEQILALRWAVDPAQLIVTAGADDGLERICRAWLDPGRIVILTKPTFSMLSRYVNMNEGLLREVPWLDGVFPVREVLSLADSESPAIVFVVSPNNPTGNAATFNDLRLISESLPSTLIVFDQAYAEFADEDHTPKAIELPNVIVTRTLSKAFGLAGLRVGYAVGKPELIAPLRVVGHPYPVSGPSLAIAASVLARGDHYTRVTIERVRQERTALAALLRAHDIWSVPSQANFVLARIGDSAFQVRNSLADRGIAVRWFRDDATLAEFLRITCPANECNFERLLVALDEVLDT